MSASFPEPFSRWRRIDMRALTSNHYAATGASYIAYHDLPCPFFLPVFAPAACTIDNAYGA